MNTYGNTGTNGDDDQSHDVGIDIKDASCSADQCHHAEAEHGDPEDGHEEAHQVVLPVLAGDKNQLIILLHHYY